MIRKLAAVVGVSVWAFGAACVMAAGGADFQKLDLEQQRKFHEAYEVGRTAFQNRKIDVALASLARAEAIFAADAALQNLKGSCLVEKRDFGKALESFRRADSLEPGNHSIAFNIAEMDFVGHRWAEAEEKFRDLRIRLDDASLIARVVDFKRMVCAQKLGEMKRVNGFARLHAGAADTPYPQFAAALLEFVKGNERAARGFMDDAARLHPPAQAAPFRDTLVEAGYVEK